MPARLLDGKALAERIRSEVKDEAEVLQRRGIQPNLQVVLVGDDPASAVYVRNKTKAAAECGIQSDTLLMPAASSEDEVVSAVDKLARDRAVHGILVQLPLPKHISEERVLLRIPAEKDVDGFHPDNIGRLVAGKPRFEPCTPAGVVELLVRNDIPIPGAHVVILGRGPTVGRPLSIMLSQKGPRGDATVTLCHSQTKHIHMQARVADILIAAMGKARFVTAPMVKRGAAVVDVGINRVLDPMAPKGERVVGDVDFGPVSELAGAISPVPGGVGPMTIAMLLHNTVKAAELQSRGG